MKAMRKLLFIAILLIGLAFGGLVLAGYFDPRPDPDFESKLTKAADHEIEAMIAKDADRQSVTALGFYVEGSDGTNKQYQFGRYEAGSLMQAASLSKAVAAAIILTVAYNEGVGLDDDIRSQITSLDIAALEGADRPVTLRQLLSHTAGASQSGYPGYPRGDKIPTTAEVIAAPPRFFESALTFDSEIAEFRYSGGGYTIAQLWAQDVSGKDFASLASEVLLRPLGMTNSTFAQPIDEAVGDLPAITGADAGFDPTQALFTSLDNSWNNYPEQAAAGLWTTPAEYALFVNALLDAAAGENSAISAQVAIAMLTPQVQTPWGDEPGKFHYGLGVSLELDSKGQVTRVSHTGANAGYRAHFIAVPATGNAPAKIAVSMANTGNAAPLNAAIVNALIAR